MCRLWLRLRYDVFGSGNGRIIVGGIWINMYRSIVCYLSLVFRKLFLKVYIGIILW